MHEGEKLAEKHAEEYLRFKLGGRRGCRVLEDLDDEDAAEIIKECAAAMLEFAIELEAIS